MNVVVKIEQYNFIGIDGFEFVEFIVFDVKGIEQLCQLFNMMGFIEIVKYCFKEVFLFQQNDINIVFNGSLIGYVYEFVFKYGLSVCVMVFWVKNVFQVVVYVEFQGVKLVGSYVNFGELNIFFLEGIGGLLLYFVDCYGDCSIYDVDFEFIEGCSVNDNLVGLIYIDYLIYNVKCGQMDVWFGFYECIVNFCEICYFDIEGKFIGLFFCVMIVFCGKICILINELVDDILQIEEFICEYYGEGIQYIVLIIDDIYVIVCKLCDNGVKFMLILDIYYEKVDICVVGYGELFE